MSQLTLAVQSLLMTLIMGMVTIQFMLELVDQLEMSIIYRPEMLNFHLIMVKLGRLKCQLMQAPMSYVGQNKVSKIL